MTNRLASVALAIVAASTLLGEAPPEQHKETAVQRKVREAKEKGLSRIESSIIADYPVLWSIDTAVKLYDFVIAVPVKVVTHVDETDAITRTVYKLRLEKFILRQPDRTTNIQFGLPKKRSNTFEVPPDLLPWAPREFVVSKHGGTAVVDGIELVTASSDPTRFEMGKAYLLILNFVDLEDRVAGLPMAGHCVWRIQDDELIPLIPATRNPLARDVVALFRGSLRRLEFALPLRR